MSTMDDESRGENAAGTMDSADDGGGAAVATDVDETDGDTETDADTEMDAESGTDDAE